MSRRATSLLCLALLVSLAVPALGPSAHISWAQPAPPPCQVSTPAPAGGSAGPLASASNITAFTLFHRLFAGHKTANTFFSPVSIALALEMLYGGARGATRAAMGHVLHLGGLSSDAVNRDAAALITSLERGEPGIQGVNNTTATPSTLRIANSLWLQTGTAFRKQFLADVERYFDARATTLDLNSPSAPTTINAWVSCATEGKIKKVVNSTTGLIMFLINAVYFQGAWTDPFPVGATDRKPFTLPSGSTLTVHMMHKGGNFAYYAGKDFQSVMLPYGRGRFSMIVVLPHRGISLARFAPRVTRANWGYWVKKLSTADERGTLSMPRVQLQYAKDLTAPLRALGMGPVFAGSDFSGVCVGACQVGEVLHNAFLHVDEHGTIAAAVTTIGLVGGGGPPPHPPFDMVVDHPFLLGIRDSRTGAILFLGAVNHP